MTCVEMQTTFGASGSVRFFSSALFISDMTAILCAMHIPAERWKITVFPKFISVNRYAACFLRLHMTSRLSVLSSCSAINAGIASSRMPPLSIICVRLNTRHSSSSNGTISFMFSVIGCAVCSRHGWVAEHKTIVAPQTSERKFTAVLKSDSISFGTV